MAPMPSSSGITTSMITTSGRWWHANSTASRPLLASAMTSAPDSASASFITRRANGSSSAITTRKRLSLDFFSVVGSSPMRGLLIRPERTWKGHPPPGNRHAKDFLTVPFALHRTPRSRSSGAGSAERVLERGQDQVLALLAEVGVERQCELGAGGVLGAGE